MNLGGAGAQGLGQDERHLSTPIQNFSAPGQGGQQGQGFAGSMSPHEGIGVEERKILEGIAQLLSPGSREAALLDLSKKREQFPQLALILWHSFGMAKTC